MKTNYKSENINNSIALIIISAEFIFSGIYDIYELYSLFIFLNFEYIDDPSYINNPLVDDDLAVISNTQSSVSFT